MRPIEKAVNLTEVHGTIYKALGIAANHACVTEGRPFYLTEDVKGKQIEGLRRESRQGQ
jgi:hypothetical protein